MAVRGVLVVVVVVRIIVVPKGELRASEVAPELAEIGPEPGISTGVGP